LQTPGDGAATTPRHDDQHSISAAPGEGEGRTGMGGCGQLRTGRTTGAADGPGGIPPQPRETRARARIISNSVRSGKRADRGARGGSGEQRPHLSNGTVGA
jgi:hypothetical protein